MSSHHIDTIPVRAVESGAPAPLGATIQPGGVNFSVFSKDASHVELLLFDDPNGQPPTRVIPLDVSHHRTYHYWHAFVPDLTSGQVYGFRAYGPDAPERGLRFDGGKVLLDPYGRAVAVPEGYDREAAKRPGDNAAVAMKNVVADPTRYDWGRIGRSVGPSLRPSFTSCMCAALHGTPVPASHTPNAARMPA